MEAEKSCNKLLEEILKELEEAKEKSMNISNKLQSQTDTLQNTSIQVEKTECETDTSTWHINYIKSTFGKIYKKIHRMPERVKLKIVKPKSRFGIRKKLFGLNDLSGKNMIEDTELSKDIIQDVTISNNNYDKIFQSIKDIKYISEIQNQELSKQNNIIDYVIDKTDITEDKIFQNRLKIKKILD